MKNNNPTKNAILPTIIVSFIVVLSVAQLVVSNKLSTDGLRLSGLEAEIASYRDKNSLLEEEIASKMSLVTISSRAAELGLVREGNIQAITKALRIAANQ